MGISMVNTLVISKTINMIIKMISIRLLYKRFIFALYMITNTINIY